MLCSRMVGEMVGRLCSREQRSPWRHALQGDRRDGQRGRVSERGEPRYRARAADETPFSAAAALSRRLAGRLPTIPITQRTASKSGLTQS